MTVAPARGKAETSEVQNDESYKGLFSVYKVKMSTSCLDLLSKVRGFNYCSNLCVAKN